MRSFVAVTAVLAVLSAAAYAAESGEAAFAHRRTMMREMGHALYIEIGKVAKGQLQYGPATVQAAQTLNSAAKTLPTLFPAGSAVKGSRMNADITKDPAKVAALSQAVQTQAAALLVAVKTGDLGKIGAAVQATNHACNACHTEYRLKTKL